MEILNNIIQCLFSGYAITVLILFILKLIFKKQLTFWKQLLLLSNCILLFTSLFYGTIYLSETIYGLINATKEDNNAFRWRVMGPYWYSYWIIAWVPILFPQILWFRKFRSNYTIALLLVPFVFAGKILERVIIIMTKLYRDYLPSSWTYYAPNPFEYLISFLIFGILLMSIYFIFREKLPVVL